MAKRARLTQPQQQAWARVRIALDLGEVAEGTEFALEASRLTPWERFGPRLRWGAAAIYGTPELPEGWCWLEPSQYRALVSASVLEEFGLTNALAEFVEVITRMREPGFRSFSATNWRELTALGY